LKFLDLFAGIGGFRQGMENQGNKCVGYVEIDKWARQSYQAIYNTEGEWTANDITKVTNEDWQQFKGKVECICAGFPCQSFSIAGRRLGFADKTRGTLFFQVARAAEQVKPRYLFLENVKGLLSHDQGRTFEVILQTLDELGYDAEWHVLNSKEFVPQNRERVIIIGHLRGESTREVFFESGESKQLVEENEIVDLLPTSDSRHGRRGTVLSPKGISSALAATDYKLPKQIIQVGNYMEDHKFKNPQPGRVYSKDGISPTLNTMTGGNRQPNIVVESEPIRAVNSPEVSNKTQNGRRIKDVGDPEFALTVRDRHGIVIGKGKSLRIRKLTPLECWRLQGFPDSAFYKAKESGVSDSQLYKQAGNSVTVPVIEFVARRLSGANGHLW
jgi:DNA (cytosine-5)-methyltransferase 1